MFTIKNYNGSITISAVVSGERIVKKYYGYSMQESIKDFKQIIRSK